MGLEKHKLTSLDYAIDVSGVPYEKTTFGLVAINRNNMNKIIKEFKREFPFYLGKRAKSSSISINELNKIIDFLNSKKVYMKTFTINNSDWVKYEKKYGHRKKHFKERMFGIVYAILLKSCSYPKYFCSAVLDEEKHLGNPSVSKNNCKVLLDHSEREFSLKFGSRKENVELRFADFVAGAGRKIDTNILKRYEFFEMIQRKIPKVFVFKSFGHYEELS